MKFRAFHLFITFVAFGPVAYFYKHMINRLIWSVEASLRWHIKNFQTGCLREKRDFIQYLEIDNIRRIYAISTLNHDFRNRNEMYMEMQTQMQRGEETCRVGRFAPHLAGSFSCGFSLVFVFIWIYFWFWLPKKSNKTKQDYIQAIVTKLTK